MRSTGKRPTVGLCDPTGLRCSTSEVPIGGSRLFRLRGSGEGEETESAAMGLQIPPALNRHQDVRAGNKISKWIRNQVNEGALSFKLLLKEISLIVENNF